MKKQTKKSSKTSKKTPAEYRFYGFGNYYISSLQQGLQSGHTIADLFVKYQDNEDKLESVKHWADKHKTMVLMNGGNSGDLKALHKFFKSMKKEGMPYPFTKFKEDKVSLNNATTYVGIVLPNEIYDLAAQVRRGEVDLETLDLPGWKAAIVEKLNQYSLAH